MTLARNKKVIDEKSDVFLIAATMQYGLQPKENYYGSVDDQDKPVIKIYDPYQGAISGTVLRYNGNNVLEHKQYLNTKGATFGFFERLMQDSSVTRSSADQALQDEAFITDGLHHQIDAQKVLKKVLGVPKQPTKPFLRAP